MRRGLSRQERQEMDFTKTKPYKIYLFTIAILPLPILWISVKQAQLIYAVLGSLFMPLLALTLLILNNRKDWIGEKFRSKLIFNIALVVTLGFFGYVGYSQVVNKIRLIFGL